MRRIIVLCPLLICAVLFTGCPIESVNPLSNLDDSNHDQQLSGTWISTSESGEAWYLHIGGGDVELGPHSKSIAPAHAISVRHQADGRVSLGTFKIFQTQIDNQKYASVKFAGAKESGLGYHLVKYSIDKNQKLSLWMIDERAILGGTLKTTSGRLAEPTANLREFLTSATHDQVFASAADVIFEKVSAR